MKIDPIQQYKELRQALLEEKERLKARLGEIEAALSNSETTATPSPAATRTSPKAKSGRGSNAISLKQAVIQALARKPLTKAEILSSVQAAGYKFHTANPANSLGVILYGKSPKFKNSNGTFSLEAGVKPTSQGVKRPKRTMSVEARAKIAAAQKKRWKKARKAALSK